MRNLLSSALVICFTCLGVAGAQEPSPPPAPTQGTTAVEGYAWAEACKSCHEDIYDSWSKTKHAKALARFGGGERKAGNPCIGCHLTASKDPIEVAGDIVNANVQCESCHGPGKAHVEAATAGKVASAPIVKDPPERVCVACHNDKSPHFRGFFYSALKGLVHRK